MRLYRAMVALTMQRAQRNLQRLSCMLGAHHWVVLRYVGVGQVRECMHCGAR